jgi:hypothetical protein
MPRTVTLGKPTLCSNDCDSDGSGRASFGLTTGIGSKVMKMRGIFRQEHQIQQNAVATAGSIAV